jgi:hypothetical protein
MSSNSQMTMPFRLRVRHVWVHGFLIGLVVSALGIGAYYFINSFSSFLPSEENASRTLAKSQSEETLPAEPNVSPQRRLTHETNLELQLSQVFKGIKETTLRKDLDGLMKIYSPSFPNFSKKVQRLNRSWKMYDYQRMDFKIQEIKSLAEDSAVVLITWDVAVKELSSGKSKDISKTYKVNFIKENEQWHIIGLKNAL